MTAPSPDPRSSPRLRAPQKSGEILCQPSLTECAVVAKRNAEQLNSSEIHFDGIPLAEFRHRCQSEVLAAAARWMKEVLQVPAPEVGNGPLIVTGHQPVLAHPGVWIKNIGTVELAQRTNGTALNLVVENDLAPASSIFIPAGYRDCPRFEAVEYDSPHPRQPWEELPVADLGRFESFPARVAAALGKVIWQSILSEVWQPAVETAQRTGRLSDALTMCRVQLDRRFGAASFELPVSQLCQTDSFLTFAAHLCLKHDKLHAIYNAAVHRYRRRNGIRNEHHPVPDLRNTVEGMELPFWFWGPGGRERQRVMARKTGNQVQLSAAGVRLCEFADESSGVQALLELSARGRFRTRALTTTLFARLCLADLFIHGIGGAKYDEMTDEILSELFQVTPPRYLTLTATVHLPLESHSITPADILQLQAQERRLRFQGDPQDLTSESRALRGRRRDLIEQAARERAHNFPKSQRRQNRAAARARHQEFREIQQRLAAAAGPRIAETHSQRNQAQQALAANQVLRSREFASVLFPRDSLHVLVENLRAMP